MIINYLPEGKLSLPAYTPLNSHTLGPHYWDEPHERLCDAYWLLAELIAVALNMEIRGYDYKAGAIIIEPVADEPVADNGVPF